LVLIVLCLKQISLYDSFGTVSVMADLSLLTDTYYQISYINLKKKGKYWFKKVA